MNTYFSLDFNAFRMAKGIIDAAPVVQGNKMIYSEVYQFEQGCKSAGSISIKYVMNGFESYEINQHQYTVGAGSFLLMNEGTKYAIQLTNQQLNEGLCVYLNRAFLQESIYTLREKDNTLLEYPDNFRDIHIDLFEGLYNEAHLGINRQLKAISQNIGPAGRLQEFSDEMYLKIAEQLARCQQDITHITWKIEAKNPVVQKELYRRVHLAKSHIDEDLFSSTTVEEIARQVNMSQFHFQRTFKQVYNISPYKYLLQQRLLKAHELLENGAYKVKEVAHKIGFNDIYSFSKAFKKQFNYAPSQVLYLKQ